MSKSSGARIRDHERRIGALHGAFAAIERELHGGGPRRCPFPLDSAQGQGWRDAYQATAALVAPR